jgi:hypothetical protein
LKKEEGETLLYREGFTDEGYSFYVEIISLIEDFCVWLEEKGFKFDSDMTIALTNYFALLETKEAVDKIVKEYEQLPVFKGKNPQEAYKIWRKESRKANIVDFQKISGERKEEKNDT